MIIPVILSGGSGTRLWPLSTPARPKQFLPLAGKQTLFQQTLARLDGLPGLADPIVVCNEAHRDLVTEQLREIGARAQAIVLEPAGRNTAPAIAVAALLAAARTNDPSHALLVLPADHVIEDGAAFRDAVRQAVRAVASGHLVTFGIVPTRAETGYGYIEQGDTVQDDTVSSREADTWFAVTRFVEKPDAATAASYLASGRYLWNSGMFVFRSQALLDELARHAPAIHAACRQAVAEASHDAAFTRLGPAFLDSPSDSIDYAVMEKTGRAAVVPLDAGWSDVGSWGALYDAVAKDENQNAISGAVVAEDCSGSYIRASSRTVAAIGLEDVVIVETADSVLVMRRDAAQKVKDIGERARKPQDQDPALDKI